METRALRVLIIDHYDSYTNNILQLLPTTSEAANEHVPAWDPVIIRYDEYKWYDKCLRDLFAIVLNDCLGLNFRKMSSHNLMP
jgi:para-aminobenzoate synthetase